MYLIINLYYKLKYIFKGVLSILYLISTFKLLKYSKIQNQIIDSIKKNIDSSKNIIIFSGGKSNTHIINKEFENSIIFLNSYNSIKNLSPSKKELILKKTVVYYQAPFHHPINSEDYIRSVNEICDNLNENAICIYNKSLKNTYRRNSLNEFEFRALSTLSTFGFLKFSNITGALFLINISIFLKLKNLKVIGFDANWFQSEIKNFGRGSFDNKNFLKKFLFNYEILYQIKIVKDLIKKSNLNIEINKNSWFNLSI